jgi:DeoR family fructose operon transcriptional repressor
MPESGFVRAPRQRQGGAGVRPGERRDLILGEVLSGNGHVEELSQRLGVSPSTIRRDLQWLAREQRVTRTYGGAVAGGRSLEQTLQEKAQTRQPEKTCIAAAAASTVEPGQTIIVDAGSTTGRLAWNLRQHDNLTVVANGLNTVLSLYEQPGIQLIVLGGVLRTVTESMVGPLAEDNLRHVFADKAFLGANGITSQQGLSSPSAEQSQLKALMAVQARELYVLADHSKLGGLPFPHLTPLDRPYTLVTDANADPEQLRPFERLADVTVWTVPVPRGNGKRRSQSASPRSPKPTRRAR